MHSNSSLFPFAYSGNGATSAVELLIDCLGLKEACRRDDPSTRPIVFIGPMEHHSNLIPWRESGCEIVMVPECDTTGNVDFIQLELFLQRPQYDGRRKMGTFSAASNVTGQICDVDRIAATLHRHGALAFFDYATASSYIKIDMNPAPSELYPSPNLVAKDAVFLSPHKMLGGVGTPGVLLVKKHLVSQVNAPSRSGGGTVFYVTQTHHRFLGNRIERYEGGTPNITGIIRVGLTFLLKRLAEAHYRERWERLSEADQTTIPRTIADCDLAMHPSVASYLRQHAPNLVLLGGGNDGSLKLPIFSFLIRRGKRFLHYNYVCAILNDLFGIQSRGGCQCAGPYSQRLLGLTAVTDDGEVPSRENSQLEDALYRFKERAELLRPGYTRLSLPFKGLRQVEIDYVLNALVWVARNGWMLMCQYRVNHRTGEWRHASRQGRPLGRNERRWLSNYDFTVDCTNVGTASVSHLSEGWDSNIFEATLTNADQILAAAKQDHKSIAEALKITNSDLLGEDTDIALEELRWFVLPRECAEQMTKAEILETDTKPTQLLGALNPFRVLPNRKAESRPCDKQQSPSCTGTRKRKPSSEADPVDRTSTTRVVFRDGEHSGEASLEEISVGIDDGELSEHCQVFDNVAGDWCSFQSFLQNSQVSKASSQSLTSQLTLVNLTKVSAVNTLEQKKAPRTSANWGCAVQTEVKCPPLASEPDDSVAKVENDDSLTKQVVKSKKFKHEKPPPKIMRLATQAVMQWEMIKEGDKLLLGLSGGKDSLSLLHCLLELQRKLPVRFEIEVCTSKIFGRFSISLLCSQADSFLGFNSLQSIP